VDAKFQRLVLKLLRKYEELLTRDNCRVLDLLIHESEESALPEPEFTSCFYVLTNENGVPREILAEVDAFLFREDLQVSVSVLSLWAKLTALGETALQHFLFLPQRALNGDTLDGMGLPIIVDSLLISFGNYQTWIVQRDLAKWRSCLRKVDLWSGNFASQLAFVYLWGVT
jgi:hypothetical protein